MGTHGKYKDRQARQLGSHGRGMPFPRYFKPFSPLWKKRKKERGEKGRGRKREEEEGRREGKTGGKIETDIYIYSVAGVCCLSSHGLRIWLIIPVNR